MGLRKGWAEDLNEWPWAPVSESLRTSHMKEDCLVQLETRCSRVTVDWLYRVVPS
jgi:hypothetical protein